MPAAVTAAMPRAPDAPAPSDPRGRFFEDRPAEVTFAFEATARNASEELPEGESRLPNRRASNSLTLPRPPRLVTPLLLLRLLLAVLCLLLPLLLLGVEMGE
jgi:hypothetical protein